MKLTRFEDRWARAALVAMFPGALDHGIEGIGAMDISWFLNDVVRTRPFKAAVCLRVAIWLVALAPVFVLGRPATIAGLAEPDRERVLGALLESRVYHVRTLAMLLKTFGAFLYVGDERMRSRTRSMRPQSLHPTGTLVSLRIKRSSVA